MDIQSKGLFNTSNTGLSKVLSKNLRNKSFAKTLTITAFTLAAALPLSSVVSAADVSVLYPSPATNDNLADGDYVFGGAHPATQSFLDEFKFSFNDTGTVSISLTDLVSSDTATNGTPVGSPNLFDNTFLTFSLFDHLGNYVGSGAENHQLVLNNLPGSEIYTLTISGKADGVFGGQYKGTVGIEAPLGATLPMFGAALLTLCIRRKRQDMQDLA